MRKISIYGGSGGGPKAGKVLDLDPSTRLEADRLLIRSITIHGN
jgi:hypothetical protein